MTVRRPQNVPRKRIEVKYMICHQHSFFRKFNVSIPYTLYTPIIYSRVHYFVFIHTTGKINQNYFLNTIPIRIILSKDD